MDSPPTSRLQLRDASGSGVETLVEWERALIEIDAPETALSDLRLTTNGVPLPLSRRLLGGRERVLADWDRSGPGRYRIALEGGGAPEELKLEIWPRKINREAFDQLLDDLQSRLPVNLALGLQAAGGLQGVTLLPPAKSTVEEEIARLRRAVFGAGRPGLAEILEQLSGDPHRRFQGTELWVRREKVRRPTTAGLARALARPGNLDDDGRPSRYVDARVEWTVDVYENRVLKAFVTLVSRRLRALARMSLGDEARRQVSEMDAVFSRAARRAEFLEDVSLPRQVPKRVTMVLLKRPHYRAAWQGYLELLQRAVIRLEEERLEEPLANLPYLYEVWGTLTALDALLDVAGRLGFLVRVQRLVKQKPIGFCVEALPANKAAVQLEHPVTGARVDFIPQRSYSAGATAKPHSISFGQLPDVAIEVTRPDGGLAVYLLDPKYKLESEDGAEPSDGRPKKVDIDKMHAYRDAIRGADGSRIVQYAATLYPGPTRTFAPGLEALQSDPGSGGELREALGSRMEQWLVPVSRPVSTSAFNPAEPLRKIGGVTQGG